MPRYFTFQDETSHKFWQIDTQQTTLTVTFGRMGTTGQTQTKTFNSVERAQQEADKLIREKTRKGYVEQGAAEDLSVPAKTQPPRAIADDAAELEAILARYEEIIRNTQADQLLPFLQGVDKRWWKELGRKINGDISGRRTAEIKFTGDQWLIVSAIAAAVLPYEQAKKVELYLTLTGHLDWNRVILPLLKFSRPTWLKKFIDSWKYQFGYCPFSYKQVREMETANIIDYEPEIFGLALRNLVSGSDVREQLGFITSDTVVINRDIAVFFEYPISLLDSFDLKQNQEGRYDKILRWPIIFTRLLSEGKLDRLWFFEKCLSVQTKDWKADLRAFYRKQIEANSPTTAEWLILQPNLFPLLAGQHPHVVNWAAGILKTIHTEPDFNVPALLEWAAPVMSRPDCKTAIKTLLTILERLLKIQPDHRPAIALLLADVFALPDLTLQTKAATLLTQYADPTDAALQEQLQTYAGQMLGTVAQTLQGIQDLRGLDEKTRTEEPTGSEKVTYQYAPPKPVQRLVPGQEVRLPETWNEFMFLIGKFISSEDPLDMEILMNALILQPKDRPDDWQEQLEVYKKRLEKMRGFYGFNGLGFLYYWIVGKLNLYVKEYQNQEWVPANSVARQLIKVYDKITQRSTLPLLSLPTHRPHWIASKVLVERLIAYQQAKESIDLADLTFAIARMPQERIEEVASLVHQVEGTLGTLLSGFINESKEPALKAAFDQNLLDQLVQNPDENLLSLWAVIARTFHPDSEQPIFEKTPIADYPNVVSPFSISCRIEDHEINVYNYNTKEAQIEVQGRKLVFEFPKFLKFFHLLIYSKGIYTNVSSRDTEWISQSHLPPALIPQYLEPVFAKARIWMSNSCDVKNELHLMLQPGFQFREMSMLVLACGLLAKKRETATLAAEVLIHHFSEQTLDVVRLGDRLGWLLAGNYAPAQRLTDALTFVKDVSPLHNKALLLTLDALFAQFAPSPELPKNTRKLLELYLDLLVKLGEQPAEPTAHTLRGWQTQNALKGISKEILTRL